MNFIKKRWLQSRWIGNPSLKEGELMRKSPQVKDGLVMGMRLAVMDNQAAVVIAEGRLISVFLPGAYQLEPEKLPQLTAHAKYDWLFPSELYFLNMAVRANQPWQPQAPLLMRDPERGLVQLNMAGYFDAQVEDATQFIQNMMLQKGFKDWPSLQLYVQNCLSDLAVALMAHQCLPLTRLAKMKERVAESLLSEMNRQLRDSGLILHAIRIQTLEVHSSMRRLLEEHQDHVNFNHARSRAIIG